MLGQHVLGPAQRIRLDDLRPGLEILGVNPGDYLRAGFVQVLDAAGMAMIVVRREVQRLD